MRFCAACRSSPALELRAAINAFCMSKFLASRCFNALRSAKLTILSRWVGCINSVTTSELTGRRSWESVRPVISRITDICAEVGNASPRKRSAASPRSGMFKFSRIFLAVISASMRASVLNTASPAVADGHESKQNLRKLLNKKSMNGVVSSDSISAPISKGLSTSSSKADRSSLSAALSEQRFPIRRSRRCMPIPVGAGDQTAMSAFMGDCAARTMEAGSLASAASQVIGRIDTKESWTRVIRPRARS
ncbi:hypothetical protein SAMN04489743_4105 [Pseudarthrobacter equi]|uniref:Uncharacterized protein n=1 Tax=Pseudarthrobacter equi TaxID=728066 RepID=A0A1H2BY36_9MICC|nr:hypothetical protein SAMN04489743_0014 [Pseudarthrobacter equi]SDT63260.1 hypothetical protein SAMN04489743_4105 [Pseudarthrobacter equi]